MKIKLLLIILLFIFSLQAFAQAPNWLWAKGMEGNYGSANSIAIDASGNVYTTGAFWGTVDFDPGAGTFNLTAAGASDIFVSKLDASGNFVWAKAMGGASGTCTSYSIATDASGNVYTTGTFEIAVDFDPGAGTFNLTSAGNTDMFISKLNSSGNFVWAKAIGGGSYDWGHSITIDAGGNVYSTGWFGGTVDFDPGAGVFNLTAVGNSDIFISKLNSSGNFIWAMGMGGASSYVQGMSITLDASANIYTTGVFGGTGGTIDFDPGVGVFNLTSPGSYSCFISKLNSSGNFVWAKAFTGGDIGGLSIALDVSGNVYTTGSVEGGGDFDPGAGVFPLTAVGSKDVFISKLNNSGNFVWAKLMGGTGSLGAFGYSISLDVSGNVYTTGRFYNTVDFDPGAGTDSLTSAGGADMFITKLNNSGNFVWAKAMGGANDDYSVSIALDASANSYVTGYFQSPSITFGSTTLTNAGSSNIFIAELSGVVGIDELMDESAFQIFPNPSDGKFTFQATIQQFSGSTICIFNLLGEKVYGQKIAAEKTEINLSNQPAGIYFVQLRNNEEMLNQKLIIQK